MNSIEIPAQAKVNLFLKVLSKRKDSYHNILTLFERISLADIIKITKIPKGIIVKSDKLITRNPKDNLVYKAAELILKHGKIKSGVEIEIKKKIPIAAGLGGGSSDAAAALIGIDKLFRLKSDDEILTALGKKLGADVPFFILDTPFAIGRGRGDKLKVVRSKARFWHLLVYPGFKAATKDVYKAFEGSKYLTPRQGSVKIQALPSGYGGGAVRRSQRQKRFGEGGTSHLNFARLCSRNFLQEAVENLRMGYQNIESMLYNDLEAAAVSKKKSLGKILKGLAHLLGREAIVSGSGPSLFCLYKKRKEAIKARIKVLKSVPARHRHGWLIFVVGTA
ncbi:MAG: 4-(cytidine 5'-diphospho)-2-C-methyl-D-erythritol kinase [Omnitrophica bacterium RIFCSPLOWO2_01_FULL_45_24]|nr:MAG: 4-(cytidine 5'-diphospho)-2-C-methyl-D-erythritol kinase [Omnitrophica bacterium RIFCSPLOWO2_12_FULL_45_13]OGW94633.1 MAG: 4-(cytidine 5'-diphospho)-2-C-methyl-D-erythritol kinase [Omnitrophica bacterium RIFCSPLOWO2_01_FULL_45_24]